MNFKWLTQWGIKENQGISRRANTVTLPCASTDATKITEISRAEVLSLSAFRPRETELVEIEYADDEIALLQAAARIEGLTIQQFLRKATSDYVASNVVVVPDPPLLDGFPFYNLPDDGKAAA